MVLTKARVLLSKVTKLDPYRASLVSVPVWFLFYRYILVVLGIYILQSAFLKQRMLSPILHPYLPFTATFICPQVGRCRERCTHANKRHVKNKWNLNSMVKTLPDCWHTSLYQILRPWLLLAQLQAVPLRQSSRHWQPCKKRCLQLKMSEWTKETVFLSSLLIFQISKYLKFWNTPVYRPVIYFAAFLCKGKFREGFIVNLREHKTKVL